jgi:uncharacterized protein
MNTTKKNDLDSLAIEFVEFLVKSDFKGAVTFFDSQLEDILSPDKLQDAWISVIKESGNLLDIKVTNFVDQNNLKIITVNCQFQKFGLDIHLAFNDQNMISSLNLKPVNTIYNPPDYVDKSLFKEVDIKIGSGDWILPGTLTLPNDSKPHPGVVLVHGSGPNDRDETILFTKVFRDLAWGLASNGIAVLRYDKRTFKYANKFTPELISKLTVKEEVIDDAISAVQFMENYPNVSNVYLIGHSLGATMAPLIGESVPSLSGLILMAAITRPLEDVILNQFTYIYNLSDSITDAQKAELKNLEKQVMRVKDPNLSDKVPAQDLPLGVSPAYWLYLRDYNPVKTAQKISMPLLILQGRRDYQVLEEKDFKEWNDAFKNDSKATLKLFPSLNHLFITGEGKSTPQDYNVEGHVSMEVIQTIIEWIKENMENKMK